MIVCGRERCVHVPTGSQARRQRGRLTWQVPETRCAGVCSGQWPRHNKMRSPSVLLLLAVRVIVGVLLRRPGKVALVQHSQSHTASGAGELQLLTAPREAGGGSISLTPSVPCTSDQEQPNQLPSATRQPGSQTNTINTCTHLQLERGAGRLRRHGRPPNDVLVERPHHAGRQHAARSGGGGRRGAGRVGLRTRRAGAQYCTACCMARPEARSPGHPLNQPPGNRPAASGQMCTGEVPAPPQPAHRRAAGASTT